MGGQKQGRKEGGNRRMGRIAETLGRGETIGCKEKGVRSAEDGKKERRKRNSSGQEEEVVRTAERKAGGWEGGKTRLGRKGKQQDEKCWVFSTEASFVAWKSFTEAGRPIY